MQIVDCVVTQGGDFRMQIPKQGVTVPEILVLRALHGQMSVNQIQPVREDKRPHGPEMERLRGVYGEKVVAACFPGALPKLPSMLEDIGLRYVPGKGTEPVAIEEADGEPHDGFGVEEEDDEEPVNRAVTKADRKAA